MKKKDNRWALMAKMGGLKKLTAVVITFMMVVSCVSPYGFASVSQDSQNAAQTENPQDVQPAVAEEQQEEQSVPAVPEKDVQETENEVTEPKAEEKKTEKEDYPAQNFKGSTSDLDVTVDAPKGAFPQDTVMNTSDVSSDEVIDAAQSLAGKDSEVVGAAACDITFSCNGKEQQPKKPVRVKLTAKKAVKGEEHEAITVSDSGHAAAMSGASSRAGAFNTDHFTVYAIIGIDGENYDDEDNEQFIRNTYEFYSGAPDEDYSAYTKIKEVIVRDGDTLATPNDPAGSSTKIFKGWFVADDGGNITDVQVKDGQKAVVSPATKKEAAQAGESSEGKTIKVYAMYEKKHTITYYTADEDNPSVFETVVKTEGEDETLMTIDEAKARGMGVPEGMYMTGWKEVGTDDKVVLSSITGIDKDWELVPVFTMGHRIVFDTRRPEIFIEDQLVPDGKKVVFPELLSIGREYMGYKFIGWYENVVKDNGKDDDFSAAEEFDFNNALTKDDKDEIRLCAKWEPSQTKYTVQVRQENAHRHQETFSVLESIEQTGKSEDTVPVNDIIESYTDNKYEWFHRSGEGKLDGNNEPCFIEVVNKDSTVKFDVNGDCKEGNKEDAVISPDGSTIVKVNYCRDSYKINYLFSNIEGDLVPDGSAKYEYDNKGRKVTANRIIGDRWLKKNNDDYKDVTLPVITAKYGEWLNECAYGDKTNAALFDKLHNDPRFMFDRRDFNGKDFSPGPAETVFNDTNKETPVKPYKKIEDGSNLHVFVYLTNNKKEYIFVSDYYNVGVTAANIISGEAKPVSSTTSPGIQYVAEGGSGYGHGHQWGIGDVSNGHTLIAVTNYKAVKINGKIETNQKVLENGRYTFYWKNGRKNDDSIEETEYIHIHYVPNPYTITFRQTRNGLVNGFGIDKNDVVSEKKISVYAGEPLTGDNSVLKDDKAVPSGGKWENLSDENGLAYASGEGEWICDGNDKFLPDKMPGRNLVFYKKWTPQSVKVIFHPNNGDEDKKQEYRVSTTTKVNRIDNPKYKGHVFGGWYLDNGWNQADGSFDKPFDFGTVLNAENVDKLINEEKSKQNSDSDNVKEIHLYAKWDATEPYRVVYDAKDGSYSSDLEAALDEEGKDTAAYAVNAKASVKGVAVPSEEMKDEGYVFVGWEIGSAGSGKLLKNGTVFSADNDNDELDGKQDCIINLVAKYEKNDSSAKLIYHSNYPGGGSDETKEFSMTAVNEAFEVESPDAEAIGFTNDRKYTAPDGNTYRFLGWTANANAPQLGMEKNQYEYFQPGEKAAAGDPQNDKKKGENELWAVWELITEEPEVPNEPENPNEPKTVPDVPNTPQVKEGTVKEEPSRDEPIKEIVKEEMTTDEAEHPNAPGKKETKKNVVKNIGDKGADKKSGSVRMAGTSGSPATGDDTQLMLCLMIMVLSGAAVTAALVVRRKVKYQ